MPSWYRKSLRMKRGQKFSDPLIRGLKASREAHNAHRNYVTLINPPFSLLPLYLPPSPSPGPIPASSFNPADGTDETEMSYLTSVCWRFHGEFANPRGVLHYPARRSRHSPRDSAVLFNLLRSWERRGRQEGWGRGAGVVPERRIHYFPCRRISRRFVLLARDSIHRRAKPGLSDSRLLPSPPPIRQVIQIKLLRKLLLYSSVRLSPLLSRQRRSVHRIVAIRLLYLG